MKAITYVFLIAASVLTVGAMVRASAGTLDAGTIAFMAWAISPYLLFGLLVFLLGRFTWAVYLYHTGAVVAGLMLLLALYCYWFAMDGTSSTEALAFIFIPIYQHIGAYVALGVGIVISKLLGKPRAA